MTPLDALCALPFHDLPDAARARVLNRLADTEIFVALARDPEGDRVALRMFDLPTGPMAVATDAEDRLAAFFAEPVAHVALPGRALAAMLAPEGVALMVNPGAPSEMLLDPAMLGWLAQEEGIRLEPSGHLVTVNAGHRGVEQDQVRRLLRDRGQGLLARAGSQRPITLILQQGVKQ